MTAVWVLVALPVALVVHALGRLVAARLLGFRIERFAIGFGPSIFSRRIGDTAFVIRAVPLAGFLAVAGQGVGAVTDDPRSWWRRSGWSRAGVILAGPTACWLMSVSLFVGAELVCGVELLGPGIRVGTTAPGSPADRAGIESGEVILTVNSRLVTTPSDLHLAVQRGEGRPVSIVVERGFRRRTVAVQPERDEPRSRWWLGVDLVTIAKTVRPGVTGAISDGAAKTNNLLAGEVKRALPEALEPVIAGALEGSGGILGTAHPLAHIVGIPGWLLSLSAAFLLVQMFCFLPILQFTGGRLLELVVATLTGTPTTEDRRTALLVIGLLLSVLLISRQALGLGPTRPPQEVHSTGTATP